MGFSRQEYWSGQPFPLQEIFLTQGLKPCLPHCRQIPYHWATRELHPLDCSLPSSSVHGTLQARILEWVAMASSRGSSWPRDQTCFSCSSCTAGSFFTTEPRGKPQSSLLCYQNTCYCFLRHGTSLHHSLYFPDLKSKLDLRNAHIYMKISNDNLHFLTLTTLYQELY